MIGQEQPSMGPARRTQERVAAPALRRTARTAGSFRGLHSWRRQLDVAFARLRRAVEPRATGSSAQARGTVDVDAPVPSRPAPQTPSIAKGVGEGRSSAARTITSGTGCRPALSGPTARTPSGNPPTQIASAAPMRGHGHRRKIDRILPDEFPEPKSGMPAFEQRTDSCRRYRGRMTPKAGQLAVKPHRSRPGVARDSKHLELRTLPAQRSGRPVRTVIIGRHDTPSIRASSRRHAVDVALLPWTMGQMSAGAQKPASSGRRRVDPGFDQPCMGGFLNCEQGDTSPRSRSSRRMRARRSRLGSGRPQPTPSALMRRARNHTVRGNQGTGRREEQVVGSESQACKAPERHESLRSLKTSAQARPGVSRTLSVRSFSVALGRAPLKSVKVPPDVDADADKLISQLRRQGRSPRGCERRREPFALARPDDLHPRMKDPRAVPDDVADASHWKGPLLRGRRRAPRPRKMSSTIGGPAVRRGSPFERDPCRNKTGRSSPGSHSTGSLDNRSAVPLRREARRARSSAIREVIVEQPHFAHDLQRPQAEIPMTGGFAIPLRFRRTGQFRQRFAGTKPPDRAPCRGRRTEFSSWIQAMESPTCMPASATRGGLRIMQRCAATAGMNERSLEHGMNEQGVERIRGMPASVAVLALASASSTIARPSRSSFVS
ncbi:hypothetical protein FQR65_LT20592 [Abscondita terminalis]|nr:hypothetical protein FQR65_LT20592 [Abscondita terminalis]